MTRIWGLTKAPGTHTDPGRPGFGIRVSPKGKAVWMQRVSRVSGEKRDFFTRTLGLVPPRGIEADGIRYLDLRQAHAAAEQLASTLRLPDHARAKVEARRADTLATVLEDYLTHRKVRGRKTGLSPETKRWYRDLLANHLSACARWPLVEMQGEVASWLAVIKKIADKSPSRAMGALNLVSGVYDYLGVLELVDRNPMRKVRRLVETQAPPRRTRHVETMNLPAFVANVHALRNRSSRDAIMVMLLSGMRKNAVMCLRHDGIDDSAVLTVERGAVGWKGWSGQYPLNAQVAAIVSERRQEASPWVFPARHGKSGHMVSVQASMTLASSGIEHEVVKVRADGTRETVRQAYQPHDLRRTFASVADLLFPGDIALHGQLLAHKWALPESPEAQITLGYTAHLRERIRRASTEVAECILEIAGVFPMSPETRELLTKRGIQPDALRLPEAEPDADTDDDAAPLEAA